MKLAELRVDIGYLCHSAGFDSWKGWGLEHASDHKTMKRRNQWRKGKYKQPTKVRGESIKNLVESQVAQFRFEKIFIPMWQFESPEDVKQYVRETYGEAEDGEYWIMFRTKGHGRFSRAFVRWSIDNGILDFVPCTRTTWYGKVIRRQPLMYQIEEWGYKPRERRPELETFEGDVVQLSRR